MAEKTKLKWLRKEFGSSEELEYYLTQLKHQDKLKSDIISLLERFQHLLFGSYEPDFLTITYNGQWDVSFGPVASETILPDKPEAKKSIGKVKMPLPPPNALKKEAARQRRVSARSRTTPVEKSERVHLRNLLDARLLAVGEKLRYKMKPSIIATVTREGNLKIGKEEFRSPSGAATNFAPAGRRDGWLCWLFQDRDGDWKPIDLLRERWKEMYN